MIGPSITEVGAWRLPVRAGVLAGLVLMAGCVSTYERDFLREKGRAGNPGPGPEGPWIGEWRSEANGHHGRLWCIIRAVDGEPGWHEFRYRAGWGVLRFGDFTHRVATREGRDGALHFDGSLDLPDGAGRYSVNGRVTGSRFEAGFQSDSGDRGRMVMARP